MATHSSILAWRVPSTEEPGGLYSPWDHKELDMTEQLSTEHILSKIFSVKFGRHDFKNILLVYPKSL